MEEAAVDMAAAHHTDAFGTEFTLHQGRGMSQIHVVTSRHNVGDAPPAQVVEISTAGLLAKDAQSVRGVVLGPQQGTLCFHYSLPVVALV